MKAVIMAGGFGTRIHPLTINLPKPMIPIFNRPIILHIIALLKKHGIDELVLLLYHQPEVIKSYFGDGSEFGVRITYVTPLEDFGTAGAVKAAAKHLDERFMIISGDLLTDFDLSAALRFHEEHKAMATLTLTSVPDPLQFGVVITDKEGRITKFMEKPGWGEVFSDTINTGIYVMEPEVLELIPENENRDWSHDVFPLMLQKQLPLFGCSLGGYWQDVGNTDSYLETIQDICAGRVNIETGEDKPSALHAGLFLGEEVRLTQPKESLFEGRVLLGDNTQVLGRVRLKNCVVGRNCVIEDGVQLDGAVIWDNVYVREHSSVKGAVLCHNVRLGKGAKVEEGAVIGEHSDIGAQALVRKDVKIWPNKTIESGATVTTNLIWGEKWRRSIFDGAMVRGLTNVELTPEFTAKLGAAYGSSLPKGAWILSGRDAFRSSRMLKRAFIGGLLSAGVSARDIKRVSLPVLRNKLTTFGEVGGVHFRQCADDPASTEIVFFDTEGNEISSGAAKGIERLFYKENFRRAHYMEPGVLRELPSIYDFYRDGFLRGLNVETIRGSAPKIVIDFGHSPAGDLLPQLLNDLGCELIEINSHVDESIPTLTPEQTAKAEAQLSRIVTSLGANAGFLLGPSGERMTLIDERGNILSDIDAFVLLAAMVCRTRKEGVIAAPVSAPHILEPLAARAGLSVKRTKTDGRSLTAEAQNRQVVFAGTLDGRFAFPCFQPNFDALFSVARILELVAIIGQPLSEIAQDIHRRPYLHRETACTLEQKGGLMRKMSEDSVELDTTYIDGVKVQLNGDWVLVLPDAHRPVAHVISEASDESKAAELVERYLDKIQGWKQDLAQG